MMRGGPFIASLRAGILVLAALTVLAPQGSLGQEALTLLGPRDVQRQGLSLSGEFAVSSDGSVVLGLDGNLFDLGGYRRILKRETGERTAVNASPGRLDVFPVNLLSSFEITDDGALVTITGQYLGFVRGNHIIERVKLPTVGMKIDRGPAGQLLMYGGEGADGVQRLALEAELENLRQIHGPDHIETRRFESRLASLPANNLLYAYHKGGQYQELTSADSRITAVTVAGENIAFAAGGTVYSLAPDGLLSIRIVLPANAHIQSLAYDKLSSRLYILANGALLEADEDSIRQLAADVGSSIRLVNGYLYLLDTGKGRLVRMRLDSAS